MIFFKRNKYNELKVWHIWFAWHPTVIGQTVDGDNIWIWFHRIRRCGKRLIGYTYHNGQPYPHKYWDWTYKYLKGE